MPYEKLFSNIDTAIHLLQEKHKTELSTKIVNLFIQLKNELAVNEVILLSRDSLFYTLTDKIKSDLIENERKLFLENIEYNRQNGINLDTGVDDDTAVREHIERFSSSQFFKGLLNSKLRKLRPDSNISSKVHAIVIPINHNNKQGCFIFDLESKFGTTIKINELCKPNLDIPVAEYNKGFIELLNILFQNETTFRNIERISSNLLNKTFKLKNSSMPLAIPLGHCKCPVNLEINIGDTQLNIDIKDNKLTVQNIDDLDKAKPQQEINSFPLFAMAAGKKMQDPRFKSLPEIIKLNWKFLSPELKQYVLACATDLLTSGFSTKIADLCVHDDDLKCIITNKALVMAVRIKTSTASESIYSLTDVLKYNGKDPLTRQNFNIQTDLEPCFDIHKKLMRELKEKRIILDKRFDI